MNALPPQQYQCLVGMACGESVSRTAHRLHVSTHTVKTYRVRLLARMGARCPSHAVGIGYRTGILATQAPQVIAEGGEAA